MIIIMMIIIMIVYGLPHYDNELYRLSFYTSWSARQSLPDIQISIKPCFHLHRVFVFVCVPVNLLWWWAFMSLMFYCTGCDVCTLGKIPIRHLSAKNLPNPVRPTPQGVLAIIKTRAGKTQRQRYTIISSNTAFQKQPQIVTNFRFTHVPYVYGTNYHLQLFKLHHYQLQIR